MGGDYTGCCIRTSQNTPSETVWKIRMGSALRSHESKKRGERHPYRRLVLPKAHDPSPSSYFPNSFSTSLVNKGQEEARHAQTPVMVRGLFVLIEDRGRL
jgi:hypothetical protein